MSDELEQGAEGGADEGAEGAAESAALEQGAEGGADDAAASGADDVQDGADEGGGEEGGADTTEEVGAAVVETARYTITGLVDIFDEQRNITGQFPIGSEQELPVEYGDRMVGLGSATKVE